MKNRPILLTLPLVVLAACVEPPPVNEPLRDETTAVVRVRRVDDGFVLFSVALARRPDGRFVVPEISVTAPADGTYVVEYGVTFPGEPGPLWVSMEGGTAPVIEGESTTFGGDLNMEFSRRSPARGVA